MNIRPVFGKIKCSMGRQIGAVFTAGINAFLCWFAFIGHDVLAQTSPPDTIAQRVIACTACHGKEGRAASDGYYPRIAGKPAGYLYNQLMNFREGRRKYPLMVYMVDHLSEDYLHEIAAYFSNLHPPYPPPQAMIASQADMELGGRIVRSGDPARNVPACIACHGKTLTGVAPSIPGLAGLPFDYMSAQLGAWKIGTRRAAEPDCMAAISSRLTGEEIGAALTWLAAQPIPSETAPATASEKLPLSCGSFPQ
jgi:cytochrome c553